MDYYEWLVECDVSDTTENYDIWKKEICEEGELTNEIAT